MESILKSATKIWELLFPAFLNAIPEIVGILAANWWIVLLVVLALYLKKHFRPQYGIKCTTNNGEEVKSHAEKLIADLLLQHGIVYQYEKPLIAGWWIFKHIVAYPDFYLPEHNIYIEYWGLVDTDRGYKSKMGFKMQKYRQYDLNLISIYPSHLENLEWVLLKKIEEARGKL